MRCRSLRRIQRSSLTDGQRYESLRYKGAMKIPKALKSRWRAIPILGLAQILSWGAIYYTPVLVVPLIAEARGWSLTLSMAGFSVGLLAAGLASPFVGRWIDCFGGHRVMPAGFLAGAIALVAIGYATNIAAYFAVWILLGFAMAGALYDPAFSTLARIFGSSARSAITLLTFIGGFASTVSWPITHLLIEKIGWQGTYQVYAGLLALVAAPLLAFALPREHAAALPQPKQEGPKTRHLPAKGLPFVLVACAFALYMFIPSALSAGAFAILFGMANGLMTIARGTVPLALFGPSGYGRLMGKIAAPVLLMQAFGPIALAFVAEQFSDRAAIGAIGLFALAALGCFLAIRRP